MPLEALIPRNELSLVLPGEVNIANLALPRPLVLWCSTGNPGAAAMAHELNDALAGDGDAIQVVERRPDVRVLEAQGKSVAMLLYLNKDTWAAQPGELERDVRATYSFAHGLGAGLVRMASNMRELRRMGSSLDERGAGAVSADKIRIVLVHEADPAKGGCEFGTFFGTTPQGLIDEGIYKDIAIALHTPPHRAGQPRPRGASPGRDRGRCEAGGAPRQVLVIIGQQWRGRRRRRRCGARGAAQVEAHAPRQWQRAPRVAAARAERRRAAAAAFARQRLVLRHRRWAWHAPYSSRPQRLSKPQGAASRLTRRAHSELPCRRWRRGHRCRQGVCLRCPLAHRG